MHRNVRLQSWNILYWAKDSIGMRHLRAKPIADCGAICPVPLLRKWIVHGTSHREPSPLHSRLCKQVNREKFESFKKILKDLENF